MADAEKDKEYTKEELEAVVKGLSGLQVDTNDYSKSLGGSKQMAQNEKEFADMAKMGGKEDGATQQGGVSEKSLKCGKWYKFLNAQGTCFLYIHNITKDITSIRPENYEDEPEEKSAAKEEKKESNEAKVPLKEIEAALEKAKAAGKIPLLQCDEATHEALLTFFKYKGVVMDTRALALGAVKTGIKYDDAMESSRKAIVHAMKEGKRLLVDLGADVAEFKTKICTMKTRDKFPSQLFTFGRVAGSRMVYEKIYKDEDKEGGQCGVRDGFETVVSVLESVPLTALQEKLPDFDKMEIVKVCLG
uniref:Uncharacterized protein n=1 Tax=Chromera velia CCMP2878 TaxID=1169474 RepID=A0A0G4HPF3_9ALVE|mmetsp:Transcript_36938/g.72640  ORF Transcript_36938/g.72640 Transcript_36938/m.72640 type:complete len:303 (-) Transcript_36938:146-1054(-)|eukprot:Cvel_7763.t1-p1 / transcript=Cvel_7763.t1 / gene=Cvel_7763 / organism=Chromera_velia_CCMP2878 / gene_product=hypothetical protein / transcript_product=hypothetical protein / location=Cvel_scaffold413:79780-83191(+) / protein_length=302 / sequence_SO=supercontig / SO=protein_coding / is_pseudo=false